MRKETARDFCVQCIDHIFNEAVTNVIKDPSRTNSPRYIRDSISQRVNKIAALELLSVEDYRAIMSGLGVRWMRSEILNAIDDALFDEPDAEEYAVTIQDGKLRSRA